MRRLLIVIALSLLALSPAVSEAASDVVVLYLYHPTSFAPGVESKLMCGWHDNCDNQNNDPTDKGLDWQNSTSTRSITVRFLSYLPSGSGSTWVGRALTTTSTFPCKRVTTRVFRIDWYRVGEVVQNHSQGAASTNYWNLFASPGGTQNSISSGYYIPYSEDNCSSSYDHVMQWYESGPVEIAHFKNYGIPHETQCFHCGTLYSPWSGPEYAFGYYLD